MVCVRLLLCCDGVKRAVNRCTCVWMMYSTSQHTAICNVHVLPVRARVCVPPEGRPAGEIDDNSIRRDRL